MSQTTPITRQAREPAERALDAMRELYEADPFVFVALRDFIACPDFVEVPLAKRQAMQVVRLVAHELKLRAVHQAAGISEEYTKAALAEWRKELH